jgi:hypothetical protein
MVISIEPFDRICSEIVDKGLIQCYNESKRRK